MVRDSVTNLVVRLQECGFDPRRIGDDAWEARCPAHRSSDYALSITRGELGHVTLECRGTQKCQDIRIIRALGFTTEHVYEETPEWLINRLKHAPIQPASFGSASAHVLPDVASVILADAPPKFGLPILDCRSNPDAASVILADAPPEGCPLPEVTVKSAGDGAASLLVAGSAPCEAAVTDGGGPLEVAPDVTIEPSETALPEDQAGTSEQTDEMREVFMLMPSPSGESEHELEHASAVEVLASVASDARLFRSNDGRLFAQVSVGDRLEIYGLKSAAFRDWLVHGYLTHRAEAPAQGAIRRAVGMLEARARFEADVPEVFVRVGKSEDGKGPAFVIDLGDRAGTAVVIRDCGWLAVDRPGVHFQRPEGLQPLPVPTHHGSIDRLRPYVNLTEADFRLMFTWLTAVLRPVGPYPILVLNGEQATAKSTLVKVLRLLIDPHTCIALNPPTSTRNLMATAVNGWLLAYDNISDVPRWLSDALCQLVYGGAISGRALFTNDDRSFIYAQRPVLLSGIGDFIRWGDLKDRCVFLQLPPIPHTRRRGEDEFWRAFHADRPGILGAVLDAIVCGLRELPSVKLAELPRMADYATWGEAVGRGLGWEPGSFLSTYIDNRKEATLTDLLDSPVGKVLLKVARVKPVFSASPAILHAKLTQLVGKKVAASADWPKTTAKFGQELRRLAPQLRMHGVSVHFDRRNEGRTITLKSEQAPQ